MSLKVDIRKRFKGFSLDVKFDSGGETLGILGASGSGKSMTLKCIAGIETPDEGHIELNGRVLYDSAQKIYLKPQQRGVGYLFQSYALFPNMTVEKNIACAVQGTKQEKERQVAALVEQYHLTGLEKRYPAQLSGGQQQRVALARILAYQPQALLLDEPFSALDTYLKEALQVEMAELLRQYEGDVVMVTHSRDEVYKLCPELMVLEEGRAVAKGGTKAMFENPGNVAVARLTGCKNIVRAEAAGDRLVRVPGWGCTLEVAQPLPEKLTHIGVRAHYFEPCEMGAKNAIAVQLAESIESPFEWNVLLHAGENGGQIWWKVAKGEGGIKIPKALCVSPQDVLLLE